MVFVGKTLRTSLAATLLLTGLTTGAQGDIGDTGPAFGPSNTGPVHIRGTVVCVDCILEEVRKLHPGELTLYQLVHKQGQLVLRVSWVSQANRWQRLAWPPRLWVRGKEEVVQQLSAEANLFKDMEITALLSNTRTLDIIDVKRADLGVH